MTNFLRTRILFSLALGLFVLTANAMADVTYDSDAGTFTGDGTYSEAVSSSINLTATPTSGQTITFTNNIVSTGNFTQNGGFVVFDTRTDNSFNTLSINNSSGGNNEKMTLRGAMTLTGLGMGNTSTVYLDVEDGAALTVSGVAYLNQANGARGVITQTGGTVSFTTSGNGDIRIGHWPNATYPSRYDISGGSLSIPNTTSYVGWDGYAEMNISGGEVSLKCLSLSNGQNQGKGTLRLTGGTLNIGDGGVVRNKREAYSPLAAEVYLGQGTVNATANQTWGNDLTLSLTGRSATDTADVAGGVTTFNAESGKTITIPSVISGVGALTKTGAGTLTLSGANAYTGATAINAGTLKLTNSATMGTGTATVASGATVEIATASGQNRTWDGGAIFGDGILKVSGEGSLAMPFAKIINSNTSTVTSTINKIVVDGADFTIDDNVGNRVDYYGVDIDINNGATVTLKRSATTGSDQFRLKNRSGKAPVITFDSNGGGTFNTGSSGLNIVNESDIQFVTSGGAKNYITGNNGFNLHNHNLTFDVAKGSDASGVDLEVSARLWNNNGIVKNGVGTMALTYANTYSGATTINAGTLKLSGSGMMGNGSGVVSIASDATLTFASDLSQTTIANPISGAGNIVKDGTNTVSLNGAFTCTGNVDIKGGTLSVRMNGSSNNFSATNLSGSGNLELRLASGTGDSRLPNLTYNSATPFTGVISLVSEGGANGNKINTGNRSFAGFTFVVNSGTSLYAESGTFAGNVKIYGDGNTDNRGALRLATNMSGIITVMDNAGIAFNGSPTVSGNISSGAATGESVTLFINGKTDGTTKTSSDNPGTFTGAISDGTSGSTLGINIRYNIQTFSGALSYTGATTIHSEGTMVLSGANANLDDSSSVTVNGTLNFAGYTGASADTTLDIMDRNIMQLNNLSGTDGVIVGTGKDLILNNDDMSKFIGSITAQKVEKTGDGTLKLCFDAENGVDINSMVVSSGRLDIKGYMLGGITVDANAIFSPGNSIGEARFGGGYELKNGATLLMEIGGKNPDQNDSLIAGGELKLDGGMVNLVLSDDSTLKGGDEFVAVLSGSNSASLQSDFIRKYVNSYFFTNLEYVQLDGSYGEQYNGKFAIKGVLDPNAVPEPSTWALLVIGIVGLFLRKRIRS